MKVLVIPNVHLVPIARAHRNISGGSKSGIPVYAVASVCNDSMSTEVDMDSLTEGFIDAHTPYGILCNNYGVCESYSEAFILTSRMAGLESIAEIQKGGFHFGLLYVEK